MAAILINTITKLFILLYISWTHERYKRWSPALCLEQSLRPRLPLDQHLGCMSKVFLKLVISFFWQIFMGLFNSFLCWSNHLAVVVIWWLSHLQIWIFWLGENIFNLDLPFAKWCISLRKGKERNVWVNQNYLVISSFYSYLCLSSQLCKILL